MIGALALRVALVTALVVLAPAGAHAASYTLFESGQVRPLALSPDGTRLFAVNTPDNRLEMFTVGVGTLTLAGSVSVGLEPVAVAARTNAEVWVVNHLSDSVSIVDVGATPPRVVRTLLVGDEPRDIVFAGTGGTRAFITTAHRGQNIGFDPQLTTEGKGRADVWVFDALNLGTTLGGTPFTVVKLFGDTPRALAVAPGGGTVYAAAFHSGNQTAPVSEGAVCDGGAAAPPCIVGGTTMPGGLPAPNTNFQGVTAPETGLIVKYNTSTSRWEDRGGRNWSPAIKFNLPDKDVFTLNANATTANGFDTGFFANVGTVLFNMVVNPVSGKIYVSNTEARNEVRFEGPGVFGGSTVRGRLHEARITVLTPPGTVTPPRHLNKHINYAVVPSPPGVKDASLATPTGLAVSSNGATLYVAAFGSSKVGVFGTGALEANTFVPSAADHVIVSGGGPSGLALDEPRGQLYVMTRFDNAVSIVNTTTRSEIAHVPLYNPEPASVVAGRPFLYDAFLTSSNGEAACASCHIFGDFDSLAWDLGNPDDVVLNDPNPRRVEDPVGISFQDFHPMKGPMTTQSLRGMANHGPMHWRGDRTGGLDAPSVQPDSGAFDEDAAFKKFNVAFGGLLGRSGPLTTPEMQAFTDFILQVTYPPNPIRSLDDNVTADELAGLSMFASGLNSDVFQPCNGCHVLEQSNGFFGSDGVNTFEFESQFFKIAHLRNLYQKVGMFGMPSVAFFNPGDNGNTGDQVRGFGFLHDGSADTVFRFMQSQAFNQTNPFGFPVPNPGGFPNTPTTSAGDPQRRQMEAFMLAFDSNLKPVVGQQVTRTTANEYAVATRIDLMRVMAHYSQQCDLVAKGTVAGEARGWLQVAFDAWQADRGGEPDRTFAQLDTLAITAGQEITYTCVPLGSGTRIALDRDEDGWYDRDELDATTDPADPASFPSTPTTTATTTTTTSTTIPLPPNPVMVPANSFSLRDDNVAPIDLRKRRISFRSNTIEYIPAHIMPPAGGSGGDPRIGGALLAVYNVSTLPGTPTDRVFVDLPASGWTAIKDDPARGYQFRGTDPDGPIRSVVVKPERISVRGGKANWTYTLNEFFQDKIALRLMLGTDAGWCTQAGPRTPNTDALDRFTARPYSIPGFVCPAPK